MTDKRPRSDYTSCVSADEGAKKPTGALVTPIFQTSTFHFASSQELIDLQEGKTGGYLYTRYSNPTAEEVEDRLAALEHTEEGLLFASGLAATASICMTFLNAGDRMLASRSLYGGTQDLFNTIFKRLGIRVDYLSLEEFKRLPDFLTEPTGLVWFETPVNPTLQVLEITPIVAAAREKGVLTVCDNTFATPINQKPLDLGVDLVMHSASKYIGGHSDLIGGAVAGPREKIEKIYQTRKCLGGVVDPHQAFLIGRGLRTLAVRVERQNQSAHRIAEFLKEHARVTRVFYPGLPDMPDHDIARKQMSGFGGMMCFEIKGELKDAIKVIDSFRIFANATSLGGVESLASLPVLTSHYGQSVKEREEAGITDSMIRLSVGLEDVDELIADLVQALQA